MDLKENDLNLKHKHNTIQPSKVLKRIKSSQTMNYKYKNQRYYLLQLLMIS